MTTIASEVNLATQKDITEIKINCAEHSTKNALMAQKLDNIEEKVDKLDNKFDTLFEILDNKFAAKWVERAFAGLIIIMALASLYFIMNAVGLK